MASVKLSDEALLAFLQSHPGIRATDAVGSLAEATWEARFRERSPIRRSRRLWDVHKISVFTNLGYPEFVRAASPPRRPTSGG
jgi:hypothetical protein